MKKENNKLKIAALASGAALLGAFGTSNANAAELLKFEDLGTGSDLRSNLITAHALSAFTSNTEIEFECGEGKCGEGKCGEGKCGEKSDKKDKKKDKSQVKAAPASETAAPPTMSDSKEMKPADKSSEKSEKPAKTEKPKN